MFIQFSVLLFISLHAFIPSFCAPIGYIGHSHEARTKDLVDLPVNSGDLEKKTVDDHLHKRLIKRKKGIVRKNQQGDIVQIPDDMVITNRGCETTKENCDSSDPLSTIKPQSKENGLQSEAPRNRPPRDINPQQYAPDPTEADFRRQVATIMLERLRQDGSRIEMPSNNQENSSITSRQKVAVHEVKSYEYGCLCGCQGVCPCQNTT